MDVIVVGEGVTLLLRGRIRKTHDQQHLAFDHGVDVVGHVRIEHHGGAGAQVVPVAGSLHHQLTFDALDDHIAWRAMLGKVAAGLEGEHEQAQRTPMEQAHLAMAIPRRVRLLPQCLCKSGELELDYWSREARIGVWPEAFVWSVQLSPP